MEIKDILTSIPSLVGSLFESIYVISKKLDKCYLVTYTGDEVKLSTQNNYESFTNILSVYKDNVIESIENNDVLNKLFVTNDNQNKIINVTTNGEYKIVLVSSITESVRESANKPEVISNKKMLLIADDSQIITKFFTKTFQDEYDIIIATNGEEAIKLVEENKDKELIGAFIDLQMPVKNGYEVLEYFKENDLFKIIPVSVISGEDSQDGIEKATNYGIVDMLQKPFSSEAAKSIVNKTISFSPKNK